MTDESQSATVTSRTQGHPDEIVLGSSHVTINPPPFVTQPPLSDGTSARLPVDIRNEYERRICELEEEVKDLKNRLESVIITLTRMFGNGQAAMQKLK